MGIIQGTNGRKEKNLKFSQPAVLDALNTFKTRKKASHFFMCLKNGRKDKNLESSEFLPDCHLSANVYKMFTQ